jgi:hypothetical protein
MTREGDSVRWVESAGWPCVASSKRERGWGSTSTRFVDHTSHRFFNEDEYKAWLHTIIEGSVITTCVAYFRASCVARQSTTNHQSSSSCVPCSLPLVHYFLPSTQVLPVYGCWKQGQWAYIPTYPYLGPRRRVRSYRKSRYKKGVGNTKEVKLICGVIHLVLASMFV